MLKMLKIQLSFFLFFVAILGFAQEIAVTEVDSLYREDQFYVGLTYNVVFNSDARVSVRGLSGGLQAGFVRDMPINKRRNWAVAVGVGLTYDQMGQNLFMGKNDVGETHFEIFDDKSTYIRNRFSMATIEVPIELRWRTSTPTSYRFWRVYTGLRVGYTYWHQATFIAEDLTIKRNNVSEFDPLRLTATLSVGYNTFNFIAAYGINPFFKDAETVDGKKIDLKSLKLGLIFYIL